MISVREIWASLYGSWRLAHLDPQGMNWFDLSAGGFYRSFFSAVLVLPVYLAALALDGFITGSDGPNWAVKLAFYPLYWAVTPIVLGLATGALGLGRGYVAAVVATNWFGVLANFVLMALGVILAGGVFGAPGSILYFIAYLASLYYAWFILRTALQTTGSVAAALTAICELVSLLLQKLSSLIS